ncbi:MAG: hypothetical protein AAF645_14040 [Myxococcota bacterium]
MGRALAALLVMGWTAAAQGQEDVEFAGNWQASALQVRHTTRSWGPDCPGRLPATQTLPGGATTVRQSGDHLTFGGGVRGSTRTCWGDNPALRRVSSRYQNGTWTIVCRTPENDARAESGRYAFTASGANQIRFRETTEWDWQLNSSRCQVTRTATRTFSRAGVAPEPLPEPEPERPRCEAGPPADVRISPSRTTVAPGERLCFSTRVVDAASCTVRGSRISLTARGPDGSQIEGRCFTASAEGSYRIRAASGALSVEASVTVASEDLSDLVAQRERARLEGGGEATSGGASGASATTGSVGVGAFAAAGGGLLVLLIAGVVLVRSRKTVPEIAPEPSEAASPLPASAPAPAPRVCPVCGYESDHETVCAHDGATLVDLADPAVQARGKICPVCRTGYGFGDTTCPKDGASLIAYALYDAQQRRSVVEEEKRVCPVCGRTFGADVAFCPHDGAKLS